MTQNLQIGDHLTSPRSYLGVPYAHHGIVSAVKPAVRVIHYSGFCEGAERGPVIETNLAGFCCGHAWKKRVHKCRQYDGHASAQRARTRLGEEHYSLMFNNCEHFVYWCIQGRKKSQQVRRVGLSATGTGCLIAKHLLRRAPQMVAGGAVVSASGGLLVAAGVGCLGLTAVAAWRYYHSDEEAWGMQPTLAAASL